MIEVGIAGNIVRWVDSFLSDRRAVLVIDGRTGKTHDIQAGLPQGSPASTKTGDDDQEECEKQRQASRRALSPKAMAT